jgi:hypothetical protein
MEHAPERRPEVDERPIRHERRPRDEDDVDDLDVKARARIVVERVRDPDLDVLSRIRDGVDRHTIAATPRPLSIVAAVED